VKGGRNTGLIVRRCYRPSDVSGLGQVRAGRQKDRRPLNSEQQTQVGTVSVQKGITEEGITRLRALASA